MTLKDLATKGHGRKYCHPLTALFVALAVPPAVGMKFLVDQTSVLSDCWERYPEVDEVTWGEVIDALEWAKSHTILNPAWCEVWISSIKSKVQKS